MMLIIAIIIQLSVIILPITTKYIIDHSINAKNFWEIKTLTLF